MLPIILATKSERRLNAFKMLGMEFKTLDNTIELSDNLCIPESLTGYLAQINAVNASEAYFKTGSELALIIGFDSIGYLNGEILDKPKTRDEEYARLKRLSARKEAVFDGRTCTIENKHSLITSIYLINQKTARSTVLTDKVDIVMTELSDKEIEAYINYEKNWSKFSLGYNPEVFLNPELSRKVWGDDKKRIQQFFGDEDHVRYGTPLKALKQRIYTILKLE